MPNIKVLIQEMQPTENQRLHFLKVLIWDCRVLIGLNRESSLVEMLLYPPFPGFRVSCGWKIFEHRLWMSSVR